MSAWRPQFDHHTSIWHLCRLIVFFFFQRWPTIWSLNFFSVTFYHLTPSTYLNISGNGWPFRENSQVDIHTAEYVRISTKSLHRIWVILVHDLSLSISCYKLRYLAKKKMLQAKVSYPGDSFCSIASSPESLEVQTLLIILFSSDVQSLLHLYITKAWTVPAHPAASHTQNQ